MKKAYDLAEILLKNINQYYIDYTSFEGKLIHSEDELKDLNAIIEKGFTLYNYIVKHELYKDDDEITSAILNLQSYMTKLQMTEENAKKLTLENAMILWHQAEIAIALLANTLLDHRDKLN